MHTTTSAALGSLCGFIYPVKVLGYYGQSGKQKRCLLHTYLLEIIGRYVGIEQTKDPSAVNKRSISL